MTRRDAPAAPALRLTLRRQIGWAEGMAAQHARIAARNPAGSRARQAALQRQALALAAARTLRSLQSPEKAS